MKITRCFLPIVGLALAAGALAGCAAGRGLSQARQADELRDHDTAVARYSKVVREHPTNQEA